MGKKMGNSWNFIGFLVGIGQKTWLSMAKNYGLTMVGKSTN
jgi:hypothetical protein